MLPIWMDSWSNGPGSNPHIYETWRITPMIRPLKQQVIGNVGEVLWLVMFIACANVTNLFLVRVEARQQELAVRTALGAGRARIVRGLLIESVMLGIMGGLVGVGLACAGVRFLVAIGPSNLPRLDEIAIDARTLAFAFALSVLSGLLFGLIPALRYAGPRVGLALQSAGRTISVSRERHQARNLLVVCQVAMALVLLVGAGLMIRTFAAMRTVDPGFSDPRHLQAVRISIPGALIAEPDRVTRTQNAILDKLAAINGVRSAGFVSEMPLEGFGSGWDEIFAQDKVYSEDLIAPLRLYKNISPGFLRTAGTRLVAGREMTWSEVYGFRPVVMVSENLAREMWGTPSAAVGKHLREFSGMPWHEVIGVIQDVRENGVQEKAPEIVYWAPLVHNRFDPALRTATFVIRSERAGTESFLDEVRGAVWSVNSELPLASIRTMRIVYDQSAARTSFTLVMLGIAGAMAFVPGNHRHLWRDVLHGIATQTRNWHSVGARSAGQRCAANGAEARYQVGDSGRGHRNRRCFCVDPAHDQSAVRRYSARSADVRFSRYPAHSGRIVGLLHSRSACNTHQSERSASLRINIPTMRKIAILRYSQAGG